MSSYSSLPFRYGTHKKEIIKRGWSVCACVCVCVIVKSDCSGVIRGSNRSWLRTEEVINASKSNFIKAHLRQGGRLEAG